jgi:peptidoglycan/xylan/chitin deacetylase (PgdA/CDA1 family)
MRQLLTTLLCASLLIFFTPGRAAVVIQYHHIADDTPAITSVSVKLFRQHMGYLADNDFKVWPLPKLVKALREGRALPDKVIAITFDDGYRSVYTHALPVLRRHGFPFSVFVTTRLVGSSEDFISWDELREAAAQGATIANHTASHPHLVRRLDNESEGNWQQRIEQEISEAEKAIGEHMGDSVKLLAYPYGEYDTRVEQIARDLGLVGFGQQSGAFDHNADWQALPRFAFGGPYGAMAGFIDKVNSLPMPRVDVKVMDDQGRQLVDPLLPPNVRRPVLSLQLPSTELAQRVSCFASGQGRIDVQVAGSSISARPGEDLPVGRSRINCTAPSGQANRFYWYSRFFMRRQADGSWYAEP